MRALLATLLVTGIAALAGVSSAGAAPPNFTAAESLCAAQGGEFGAGENEYVCVKPIDVSGTQLTPARVLCEQVYGGLFLPDSAMGLEFDFCVFDV